MVFKISTPIVAVCALIAFIAIQLAYEYPISGLVYLFFAAECIAIFKINLLFFIGLMLGDRHPPLHVWVGFVSLLHASCFISLSVALIISCSGETIEGVDPRIFEDNYKIKVLVGSSFGIITSIILLIQFIFTLKTIAAL